MKIADLNQIRSEWPVEFGIDGGVAKFTGVFQILDDDEMESAKSDDRLFIRRVLIGWSGIESDDGAPLPFCEESLSMLSKNPIVRGAIINAYYECLGDGVLKNWKRQRATGSTEAIRD